MNVLFLTLVEINSVEDRGIYHDLLRKFRDEGHKVTVMTPVERRRGINTNIRTDHGIDIVQVKTFNIQKTNIIEKGIGTLAIEYQFLAAIKKYLSDTRFDLILYSTPPVTFSRVISYVKNRDGAWTYLLLKDIFPQNAVDMGMMKKGMLLYRFFRAKEKQLYEISDTIGCMSPANVDFVTQHNPQIKPEKLEENPNTVEPVFLDYLPEEKAAVREKYGIPQDKKVFFYGGNLGKPQGIDFLLETVAKTRNKEVFFVIVGSGTEFSRIQKWFKDRKPENALLLAKVNKDEYDRVLAAGDVGMIFLHEDFLIPNFPSRLLSYLEMKMPVLAATDPNSDIGDIVENAGCGYKVAAGNQQQMQDTIEKIVKSDIKAMGDKAWQLLQERYLVDRSYQLIMEKLSK